MEIYLGRVQGLQNTVVHRDANKRGFCELLMLIGRGNLFLDNFYSVLYQSKILEFENEGPLKTPSTEIENNIFGVQKKIMTVSWLRKLKQLVLKITCQ